MSRDLLESLRTAVNCTPDDLTLRMHLARLLVEAGQPADAVRHAAVILQRDPDHPEAVELIRGLSAGPAVSTGSGGAVPVGAVPVGALPAGAVPAGAVPVPLSDEEVLSRLDSEFVGVVPPMFVESGSHSTEGHHPPQVAGEFRPDPQNGPGEPDRRTRAARSGRAPEPRSYREPTIFPVDGQDLSDDDLDDDLDGDLGADLDLETDGPDGLSDAFAPEPPLLTLADVGGMEEVKARLEAAVLAPIRNPDLVRLYAKSLRGGLLLYGPPGCGKTFIARALAGEIGARLLSVSLADVHDVYIGQSERNLRAIFEIARHSAPCVIFLDEIDALGQRRSQLRGGPSRGTVNQLLAEMDGSIGDNDGVYVLAATNHLWDVDVALRRPGRFDRTVLVRPPDQQAREAVLRRHLRDRPIAAVDAGALARMTAGYSGADLAYICEGAAERALLDSIRSGRPRLIEMADLEAAVRDTRPSLGPWLRTARAAAEAGLTDGGQEDLLAYLRCAEAD